MDFYKFALYSFVAIILWNSFWTAVFYWFGAELLNHINLLIIAGGIFIYIMFVKSFKEKLKGEPEKESREGLS